MVDHDFCPRPSGDIPTHRAVRGPSNGDKKRGVFDACDHEQISIHYTNSGLSPFRQHMLSCVVFNRREEL